MEGMEKLCAPLLSALNALKEGGGGIGRFKRNYDRKNVIPHGQISCLSMNFGVTKRSGYKDAINNTLHPDVYAALKHVASELKIECNAYTVNKNLQCKMHTDKANVGESTIVGMGDYTGGELLLESKKDGDVSKVSGIDIKYRPFTFDGHTTTHGTAPFVGTRYSIIFYSLGNKIKE